MKLIPKFSHSISSISDKLTEWVNITFYVEISPKILSVKKSEELTRVDVQCI